MPGQCYAHAGYQATAIVKVLYLPLRLGQVGPGLSCGQKRERLLASRVSLAPCQGRMDTMLIGLVWRKATGGKGSDISCQDASLHPPRVDGSFRLLIVGVFLTAAVLACGVCCNALKFLVLA